MLRNILGVIAGIVVGFIINFIILIIGVELIPPPEGVSPMDPESIKSNMHLFEPVHFITPFLAHALMSLVGCIIAGLIAVKKSVTIYVLGVLFLILGIINVTQLPSPTWFNVLDIAGAYLPMAWIANKIVAKKS